MRRNEPIRPSFRRSLRRSLRLLWLAFFLSSALLPAARAYVLQGESWPAGVPIVMDLQLGYPTVALIDGSSSWNNVAKSALDVWNPYLTGGLQFQSISNPSAPAQHDGVNTVFYSDTIYGQDFGSDTLAITLSFFNNKTHLKSEADVVFNSAAPFNSYRGPVRTGVDGRKIYDLRRAAVHEFGHVLGLDHVEQDARSIMTPVVTDLDTIQPDDTAGIEALYGVRPGAPVITSALSTLALPKTPFTYQITATGDPTSFQATGLPPGFNLDPSTGRITGTAATTTDVNYKVSVSAANAAGTTTATISLVFEFAPVFTSGAQITGIIGAPFRYEPDTDNVTARFAAGDVPPGLKFDPSFGFITGTPTTPGTYPVTLQAIGYVGDATLNLTIVIAPDVMPTALYSFPGYGPQPIGGVIQSADGNFYGATGNSLYFYGASIFRVSPTGVYTDLHVFNNGGANREGFPSSVIQGHDGNLYGTTNEGGANEVGSVFKLTPDGVYSTVYSFKGTEANEPNAGVIQGADGSLYGTTTDGVGDDDVEGTVFKLTPDGTLTTMHRFGYDAGHPSALLQAADGNLYGTTDLGNADLHGSVFRLTPAGEYTTLHAFDGTDGSYPGGLIQGADGLLYGATGGTTDGAKGTIFRLAPDGTLVTLHRFTGAEGSPSRLVQAGDGSLYGTGGGGSTGGYATKGTLFRLTQDGTLTTLHYFTGTSGGGVSALTLGVDGGLYGTTGGGYNDNVGQIFKVDLGLQPPSSAVLPVATLAAATPSAVVGGAAGVYTITLSLPPTTDLTIRYTVQGNAVNGTDYVQLSGTKKIKAGNTSRPLKIRPQGNLGGAAKRTVKITLAPGDGYTVGTTTPVKMKVIAAP